MNRMIKHTGGDDENSQREGNSEMSTVEVSDSVLTPWQLKHRGR